jgi:V/A-type H+-transporting ATPase subunit D
MGLLKARASRRIAGKGAVLLRSKREALANDLFRLSPVLLARREQLEGSLRRAARALTLARALDGEEALLSLALAGGREIPVEIERRKVWGVPSPKVVGPRLQRSPDARGAPPYGVSLGAAATARAHEEVLEILLDISSEEIRLKRLGEAINKTSRRINALERFLIPRLEAEMARIGLALEEREREDLSRLKRFKARGREPTPSR